MSSKVVYIDGVGEVVLEHSRRVKYIHLSVRPFKGIRVAVPPQATLQQGEFVARAKISWLKKHVARMAAVEKRAADFNHSHAFEPAGARAAIVQRTQELAAAHGFSHVKICIRNQKTRWGSCSLKNNINLNIHLAQLPAQLMDYVILHELVHTRVRHHGIAFWEELGLYIDSPRWLDRELNRYGFLLVG